MWDSQVWSYGWKRLGKVLHRQWKVSSDTDAERAKAALGSFFRREARGDFQIDCSSQLWRLLVKLTLMKARAKARHHTAEKRNVTVEFPNAEALISETVVREPRPDEAAALVDHVDVLLHGLPDLHGKVLRMRLEGHSVTELAEELEVSRQTVYRVLHLLQERLTEIASTSGG
ncbi:MAG: ECF-type sigma factor [Planctomycetota bacterium]